MKEFEQIYEEYQADVWRFLLCLTGYDVLTAEELTQETFYQAFLYFERFRGECQLRTWLFQIAKNVHGKYVRKESRQRQIITQQSDSSPPPYFTEQMERKEQILYLRKAIAQLDEPAKSIVEYRIYSELSYAEIAKILKIREGTASVVFNRAKTKIRKILKEVYHYEI